MKIYIPIKMIHDQCDNIDVTESVEYDEIFDSDFDNEELENKLPQCPENYVPNKKFQNLKNEIFKKNSIDPITGKYVKQIWARKVSKMGREIWHQVWQYYRDRKRADVESCYKKFYHTPVKVIYSGEPRVYYYLNKQPIPKPEKPPKELEMAYKEKRNEHKQERKNLKLLEREMKKVIQREEQKKHLELLKLQKEGKIILPPKIPKRNPDKYSKEGRERIKARLKLIKEGKQGYNNFNHSDNKFNNNKYVDNKYADNKFNNNKYADNKFNNNNYVDNKYADNKFNNNKYADNKFNNKEFVNNKFVSNRSNNNQFTDNKLNNKSSESEEEKK